MKREDLETKRALARRAMGGTEFEEKKKRRNLLVEKKRKEASQAMEGEAHQKKREETEAEIQKRREEARKAMESPEQRADREQEQEIKRQKEITQAKLARIKKETEETELSQKQKEEQKKYDEQTAKSQKQKQYLEHLEATNILIDNITKKERADIETYRTLRSDLNKTVSKDNLSMTDIALKERGRNNNSGNPVKKRANIIIKSLVTIVLCGIGIWVVFFAIQSVQNSSPTVADIDSIIVTEGTFEIKTDAKTSNDLKQEIRSYFNPGVNIPTSLYIYLTQENQNEGKKEITLLSSQELFTKLAVDVPIDFSYFLTDYMIGGFAKEGGASPFFIFKTSSFANTFDTLLKNDQSIIKEILLISKPTNLQPINIGRFSDKVIKNIDTRIATDEDGNIIAIYAFPSPDTLVITESQEIFEQIIKSMQSPTI